MMYSKPHELLGVQVMQNTIFVLEIPVYHQKSWHFLYSFQLFLMIWLSQDTEQCVGGHRQEVVQ